MSQNNSDHNNYIEAEVIESQPLANKEDTFRNYDQHYPQTKNSKKGCYITMGCIFIFIVGLITVLGTILGLFTDILSLIF